MESEVPKANSIDSMRRTENGHIWDKPECFPFFNLSSQPPHRPHPQASVLLLNVTRFVLHGLYQIYSWKHKPNFAQCGLFREPGCVTLIEISVRALCV